MNLNEIIVQLCRLKECDDIPLKYKSVPQEIIHSLNYIHSAQVLGIDEEDAGKTDIDPIWDKWIAMANGEME